MRLRRLAHVVHRTNPLISRLVCAQAQGIGHAANLAPGGASHRRRCAAQHALVVMCAVSGCCCRYVFLRGTPALPAMLTFPLFPASQLRWQTGSFLTFSDWQSAKCFHKRSTKMNGRYYASIFLHYRPIGWNVTTNQVPMPRCCRSSAPVAPARAWTNAAQSRCLSLVTVPDRRASALGGKPQQRRRWIRVIFCAMAWGHSKPPGRSAPVWWRHSRF